MRPAPHRHVTVRAPRVTNVRPIEPGGFWEFLPRRTLTAHFARKVDKRRIRCVVRVSPERVPTAFAVHPESLKSHS